MLPNQWRSALMALGALVLVSMVVVQAPGLQQGQQSTGPDKGELVEIVGPGETTTVTDGTTGGTAQGPGKTSVGAAGNQFECKAGRNGGKTDVGVTAREIRLASTHVQTGPGSSFLGLSHFGMEAVVARVNSQGGICGRRLVLNLRDDGWDAARGRQFLEDFIRQGYFAIPVAPSSEGLTAAINAKVIGRSGVPVVGTDGMLKEQYKEPFVWPVAVATVSQMRVMAKHAYDKGARTFGIVYDNKYKFGLEGATAFKDYVGGLAGAKLKAYVGIQPLQQSFNTEAKAFNDACEAGDSQPCDFVAFLLEPGAGTSWVKSQPVVDGEKKGFGKILTGGAQPLFNDRFARDCGDYCNGMLVWTGYNPPVGPLKNLAGVNEYVQDVTSLDRGVDVSNQFLQGSYLGMKIFVEALKKVGPNLTRLRVKEIMDQMSYASDLAPNLQWSAGNHFANQAAQPFKMNYASGDFSGFSAEGSGFVKDPTPGVVPD